MEIVDITQKVENVSKIYTEKHSIDRDKNWFILKLQEETGELIQSYLSMIGKGRKRGKTQEELEKQFKHELADVFCHTLLIANKFNINLEEEISEKWLTWLNKEN